LFIIVGETFKQNGSVSWEGFMHIFKHHEQTIRIYKVSVFHYYEDVVVNAARRRTIFDRTKF